MKLSQRVLYIDVTEATYNCQGLRLLKTMGSTSGRDQRVCWPIGIGRS